LHQSLMCRVVISPRLEVPGLPLACSSCHKSSNLIITIALLLDLALLSFSSSSPSPLSAVAALPLAPLPSFAVLIFLFGESSPSAAFPCLRPVAFGCGMPSSPPVALRKSSMRLEAWNHGSLCLPLLRYGPELLDEVLHSTWGVLLLVIRHVSRHGFEVDGDVLHLKNAYKQLAVGRRWCSLA